MFEKSNFFFRAESDEISALHGGVGELSDQYLDIFRYPRGRARYGLSAVKKGSKNIVSASKEGEGGKRNERQRCDFDSDGVRLQRMSRAAQLAYKTKGLIIGPTGADPHLSWYGLWSPYSGSPGDYYCNACCLGGLAMGWSVSLGES